MTSTDRTGGFWMVVRMSFAVPAGSAGASGGWGRLDAGSGAEAEVTGEAGALGGRGTEGCGRVTRGGLLSAPNIAAMSRNTPQVNTKLVNRANRRTRRRLRPVASTKTGRSPRRGRPNPGPRKIGVVSAALSAEAREPCVRGSARLRVGARR
ncbi:hypothetical protein [Prauserella flavalba]|uniref:hypothetical protein n=1 Tax=Prauserella flavalba TaxID=1477506 RepID=UPI0011B39218|nr:hypothetical protein [Prauserella flavalba]